MKNSKSSLLLLFIIAILTSACGGGNDDNNPLPGNDPPSSSDLNPGIPGKLFFQRGSKGGLISGGEEFGAWTMDVSTGKYVKIPNTSWNDRFLGNWSRVRVSTIGYERAEFLIEVQGCQSNPPRTCFAIQDMDGNYLSQFDIIGDNGVASLLSRNGHYIGYINPRGISTSSDRWLEIYDRNGILLSSSKLEDRFIRRFVWLPGGRVIYSSGRSFYFTGSYSAESEYTLTLPDDFQGGDIGQFTASPDGERLAFAVDGVPYVMDINGAGIRKLAVLASSQGEIAVNGIAWSPDSQWIMLAEGVNTVPPGPRSDWVASRRLYVLPSEDIENIFVLSPHDDRSPEVRLLRRYQFSEYGPDYTNGVITDAIVDDPHWVQ